ncbi:hypothetical protein PC119_g14449 [Phytophthora cactorum]|nr:hypothetical protein PC119_g14449 [Phytophthora cactorum]
MPPFVEETSSSRTWHFDNSEAVLLLFAPRSQLAIQKP